MWVFYEQGQVGVVDVWFDLCSWGGSGGYEVFFCLVGLVN